MKVKRIAGARSGIQNKFKFEQNNRTTRPTNNTLVQSLDRPYTTQNEMKTFRLKKAKAITSSIEAADDVKYPKTIEKCFRNEKPKERIPRPQTMKDRKRMNNEKFRVKNGLDITTNEIGFKKSKNNELSLQCNYLN